MIIVVNVNMKLVFVLFKVYNLIILRISRVRFIGKYNEVENCVYSIFLKNLGFLLKKNIFLIYNLCGL